MSKSKQPKFLWVVHWILPLILFLFSCSLASFFFVRTAGIRNPHPLPLFTIEDDVVGDIPVYPPHAIIVWVIRYKDSTTPAMSDAYQHASITIFIGILVFTVLRVLIALSKRNKLPNTGSFGTARWATVKELSAYGYTEQPGIILGQHHAHYITSEKGLRLKKPGTLLATRGDKHILIAAPTRSGKGINNVIPTLGFCPDSMIVLDIKSELWYRTSHYREQFSDCYRIDPTRKDTTCYNPLDTIPRDPELAIPAAQQLAEILVPDEEGSNSKHWVDSGRNFLSGVIVYVVTDSLFEKKTLHIVKSVIDDPKTPLKATIRKMKKSAIQYVRETAQNIESKPENERGSVISTAMKGFTLYADPKIAHLTSHSDILPDDLRTRPHPVTLYLCCPPSDLQRILPLYNMIITSIIRTQIQTLERPDYKHRLVLLLDEFPLLGKNTFLEKGLAYFAGYNIIMVLIIQSINQLKQTYGQNTAIMDNTHIKVVFASGDPETQKTISKLLGQSTIIREGRNTSGRRLAGMLSNMSVNQNEAGRALLTEDEVGTLPENECVILTTGKRPYKADIIRYFEDPRFIKKAIINFPLHITDHLDEPPASVMTSLLQPQLDVPVSRLSAKEKKEFETNMPTRFGDDDEDYDDEEDYDDNEDEDDEKFLI